MKFLNQNRGILTRILRLLGIGQIPSEPLDLEPVLVANSPDSYAEFQLTGGNSASGTGFQTATFGNPLDARKEIYITAITLSHIGIDGSFSNVDALIDGAYKPLIVALGWGLGLGAAATGATCLSVSFPVPKKIDNAVDNLRLQTSSSSLSAYTIHGYQV